MAIKTIQEIAVEGRVRAGSGSAASMKAEIGKLRAENAALARMVVAQGKKVPDGVDSSQLAGIVMCSAVEVDATELGEAISARVKSVVAIDEDTFEVYVKLSLVDDSEVYGLLKDEPEGVIAQPREELNKVRDDLARAAATMPMPTEPCLPAGDEPKKPFPPLETH